MHRASRIPVILVTLGLVATVTCREPAPPLVPTTIALSATTVTLDAVGATFHVTAVVHDQHGAPLANAVLAWAASGPAVTVLGSDLSAMLTAAANGTATVTATAGAASATVQVTVSQVETALRKVAGDAQAGVVGTTLELDVTVSVEDRLGSPIPDQVVTFAVTEGGGTVTAASVTTGADGRASTKWTLGLSTAVAHRVTVTSPGGRQVLFAAEARAGPPVAMALHAGDGQTAVVGTAVATPPAVRITDAHGNGVALVDVVYTVLEGGGTLTTAAPQSNASGVAAVGSWTLGSAEGTNTLRATAPLHDFLPVTFTASAVAFEPATVVLHAGNNFAGMASQPLGVSPAVLVRDTLGQPIANRAVTFAVTSGGGSVTGGTVMTGADGVATVGSWILGVGGGPNTLTATVSGAGVQGNGVEFRATGCTGGGGSGYEVTICFMTTMAASERAAFEDAQARWSSIITGDLTPVSFFGSPGGGCTGMPRLTFPIDDLVIYALVETMDGPGGVLGSATLCGVRQDSMPAMGLMRFDAADLPALPSTLLPPLILHEMGHIIGIGGGPRWASLLRDPASCSPVASTACAAVDTHFDGVNAIAGFDAVGGTSYVSGSKVPVENCASGVPSSCGPGTRNVHWREATLQNELMTGYLNQGSNPLSILTIRALQDLGYTVNPAAADPFFVTLAARMPGETEVLIPLHNDVEHHPIVMVDRNGRVVRVIPQ